MFTLWNGSSFNFETTQQALVLCPFRCSLALRTAPTRSVLTMARQLECGTPATPCTVVGCTQSLARCSQAHEGSLRSLVWSNSESWLLSADADGIVKYWQARVATTALSFNSICPLLPCPDGVNTSSMPRCRFCAQIVATSTATPIRHCHLISMSADAIAATAISTPTPTPTLPRYIHCHAHAHACRHACHHACRHACHPDRGTWQINLNNVKEVQCHQDPIREVSLFRSGPPSILPPVSLPSILPPVSRVPSPPIPSSPAAPNLELSGCALDCASGVVRR